MPRPTAAITPRGSRTARPASASARAGSRTAAGSPTARATRGPRTRTSRPPDSRSEAAEGVHGGSAQAELEVQVRAAGAAGGADRADPRAREQAGACAHGDRGEVGVPAGHPEPVADDDEVAVARRVPARR